MVVFAGVGSVGRMVYDEGRVCDGGMQVVGPGGGKEYWSGWGLVRLGLLLNLLAEFLYGLLL